MGSKGFSAEYPPKAKSSGSRNPEIEVNCIPARESKPSIGQQPAGLQCFLENSQQIGQQPQKSPKSLQSQFGKNYDHNSASNIYAAFGDLNVKKHQRPDPQSPDRITSGRHQPGIRWLAGDFRFAAATGFVLGRIHRWQPPCLVKWTQFNPNHGRLAVSCFPEFPSPSKTPCGSSGIDCYTQIEQLRTVPKSFALKGSQNHLQLS